MSWSDIRFCGRVAGVVVREWWQRLTKGGK